MSTIQLINLLSQGDWAAVELARELGPRALGDIIPYLDHDDEILRLLAVDCLVAAGGAEAPEALLRMLGDGNEQVRINAVNGLHKHLPVGHEMALLDTLDQSTDPYLQQQIPLILGRMHNEAVSNELVQREQRTSDSELRDNMTAALSKLHYAPAGREFTQLLSVARGERIAELIELVQYIDEPWLLPHLRPVLDRREEALRLSSHRTTLIRRGCDLAVDEVLRLSGQQFSFSADPIGQYTDAQISEVVRYLDKLAEARR